MNRIVPSAQLQPSAALPRQTLCSSKPAPLALEARLMFDGAAVATERPAIPVEATVTGAETAVLPLDKGVAAVETQAAREGASAPASTPRRSRGSTRCWSNTRVPGGGASASGAASIAKILFGVAVLIFLVLIALAIFGINALGD